MFSGGMDRDICLEWFNLKQILNVVFYLLLLLILYVVYVSGQYSAAIRFWQNQ